MILVDSVETVNGLKCRSPVRCQCEHCGKIFCNPKNIVLRALKGSNKGRYCSVACRMTSRASDPGLCEECGVTFVKDRPERIFCSHSCSNKALGDARKVNRICKNCGIQISNKSYCSRKCNSEFIVNTLISKWDSGEFSGTVRSGLCQTIRNYIIKESGGKCSKCGWDKIHPVTGKCPIQVNHIDGDSEHNRRENLEVLCANCHTLTPNYGRLNKISKRTYRKKYYKRKTEDLPTWETSNPPHS